MNRQQSGRLPRSHRRRQQAGVGRGRREQVTVPGGRKRASATLQQHLGAPHIVEARVRRQDENRRHGGESRSRCRGMSDCPAAYGSWYIRECPVAATVAGIRTQTGCSPRRRAGVCSLRVVVFVVAGSLIFSGITLDWQAVQGDVTEKQKSRLSPSRVLTVPPAMFSVSMRFFATNGGGSDSGVLAAGSRRHRLCLGPTEEVN